MTVVTGWHRSRITLCITELAYGMHITNESISTQHRAFDFASKTETLTELYRK